MCVLNTSETTVELSQSGNMPVPASEFDFQQLAEIYNAARVDYIVPMPMNAKRMQEYIESYDIDLDISVVAMDMHDGQPNGISMFGVREGRGWVTRLGVIPERRRRKTGEFLMREMIYQARQHHLRLIQLEVIKGNDPAYALFKKVGFEDVRELTVIRRAPSRLKTSQLLIPDIERVLVEDEAEIMGWLAQRETNPSWVEETGSLRNAGNLKGLRVTLPDGNTGWIVLQRTAFLLTHFVMQPDVSHDMRVGLITGVHQQFPMQDTRIENLPVDHPALDAYRQLGYVEAFRRNEMVLKLE
jgi:ribosomal protein S18 acetylase RimI-like enzyme